MLIILNILVTLSHKISQMTVIFSKRYVICMYAPTCLFVSLINVLSISLSVKIIFFFIFKTNCMCVYDVALWSKYSVSCLNKFRSCCIKCMKLFFGYNRYDSVTQMLLNIGLPSFNTVMHNCQCIFTKLWLACPNTIVGVVRSLCHWCLCLCFCVWFYVFHYSFSVPFMLWAVLPDSK